jgi:photosystem II stability/assembly factor-like uncharacterized protein
MIPCELVAGTADGIRRIQINESGESAVVTSGLHGQAIRGIAIHPERPQTYFVAAGLRGWGLHVTEDGGRTFNSLGFEDRWCWDVVVDPANSARLLVGTEPPMLWESLDSGITWREFPNIDSVPGRGNWTFFHPPFHAGHLHGIALSEERPERILVGVEHGGLLLSQDGGNSWTDVMPGADLHRIEIHPRDPDRIFAGAGNGLFLSEDCGESWKAIDQLYGRYVHGIVIDSSNPRRMFVYIDSTQNPIFRSADGGESWEPAGTGLPASRPADPLRLHPSEPGTLFYAADSDEGSTLYISEDDGVTWHCTGLSLPKVWRLKAVG